MNTVKEEFLRDFLARQREIGRKGLSAVAAMSQANAEMILMSGLDSLHSKKMLAALQDKGDDHHENA